VLGVQIHTNTRVESLEACARTTMPYFSARHAEARLLPVEGSHLEFVLGGIDFLRAVRSGERCELVPVVVIGGGNVAIDVALTALRQERSMWT